MPRTQPLFSPLLISHLRWPPFRQASLGWKFIISLIQMRIVLIRADITYTERGKWSPMKSDRRGKASDVLAPALVIHTDIIAAKARGIYVKGVGSRRYMDFSSGLATANTGHNHPHVTKAISEQAKNLLHAGGIFYHEPLI